jgi:hypothetical protein
VCENKKIDKIIIILLNEPLRREVNFFLANISPMTGLVISCIDLYLCNALHIIPLYSVQHQFSPQCKAE